MSALRTGELNVAAGRVDGQEQTPVPAADLIVEDGAVITVDSEFSVAQALAVRDGIIVAVGTEAEVAPLRGPQTRVMRLRGGAVLPGINDSHLHGAMVWAYWPHVWMEDAESWKARRIARPRPVDSPQKAHEAVSFVQRLALSLGITSYTEPGLGRRSQHQHGGSVGDDVLRAYLDQAAAGTIATRVNVLLNFGALDGPCRPEDLLAGLKELPVSPDPRHLAIGGVKLFADGSPAARKGWMNEPYLGSAHAGALTMTQGDDDAERLSTLRELVAICHRAGLAAGVHCSGSRAIDEVVRAIADAMDSDGRTAARHYIIHGDCASRPALERMAAAGIGMTTQPGIYAVIGELIEAAIGLPAADDAFPLRTALAAGVKLGLSSDAPIVTADWRSGLVDAVQRRGAPADPERQRISLEDAIRCYTINGAWFDGAESWKGSIEVGKVADLCLLDGDPLAVPVEAIGSLAVTATLVGGEVLYEKGGFTA
jgi:predicted amidohydrolase YtcJ